MIKMYSKIQDIFTRPNEFLPGPPLKFCQFAVLRTTCQNRRDPIFFFRYFRFFIFFGVSAHSEMSSAYLVMSIAASKMPYLVISIAQTLTILSIVFFSVTDKRLLNNGGVQLRCLRSHRDMLFVQNCIPIKCWFEGLCLIFFFTKQCSRYMLLSRAP